MRWKKGPSRKRFKLNLEVIEEKFVNQLLHWILIYNYVYIIMGGMVRQGKAAKVSMRHAHERKSSVCANNGSNFVYEIERQIIPLILFQLTESVQRSSRWSSVWFYIGAVQLLRRIIMFLTREKKEL